MDFTFRPLVTWPREKTPIHRRKSRYTFKAGYQQTISKLTYELGKLGTRGPVMIQAAFAERDIRLDGLPRADARRPDFAGVIVAATTKHGPLQFLCDDCQLWEHNLHAIALTLERLRLADLYGVTKRGEQYAGWKALPPAIVTPAPMSVDEAARFCGTHANVFPGNIMSSLEHWRTAYRRCAQLFHPDTNGGTQRPEWNTLQLAAELLNRRHGL